MTRKELLFKCLRHEELERNAWVSMAGVHAGFLKGYTADEVYRSADKLVESLLEVNKLYRPDGLILLFDLQLEAEILGCTLKWEPNSPPCVRSHPLEENMTIPTKDITPADGRMPIVVETCRRIKAAVGDEVALYGLFCGPYTLSSHLRGTNFFRDMRKNPDYVHELMAYSAKLGTQMADIYASEGVDVIVAVDPVVSQVSPKHFKEFIAGPYTKLFNHIREHGKFSSFFVCGNATHLIESMCQTGPDSVAIDENVDIKAAHAICDKYNVVIGGNIPLTTALLLGNQMDNIKAGIDLIDRMNTHRNFIVQPGCDMPYATPIENVVALAQAVLQTEKSREMVANYESTDFDIDVELPDYEHLKHPLLEAFLLDPDACAACTYMQATCLDMKKHFGDNVDYAEYRYNNVPDIARTRKMKVAQLPSLYLNGKLLYSSIIPNPDDLVKQIEEVM